MDIYGYQCRFLVAYTKKVGNFLTTNLIGGGRDGIRSTRGSTSSIRIILVNIAFRIEIFEWMFHDGVVYVNWRVTRLCLRHGSL